MDDLKLCFEGNDFTSEFFKNNIKHQEVSLVDCDYLISSSFEMGIKKRSDIQKILNKYKNLNKKVIIFLISDSVEVFDIPRNVFLFRTSLYKKLKKTNEFLLPYIWETFDEKFNSLEKTEKPIVGFCGNVKNNTGKRQSTINAISSSKNITSNFDTKLSFWGGNPHNEKIIEDFKKNILESHFTICNRGVGNFSMRFYQVLSLGRIPVLIDSDMIFPFENEINWDNLIIKANNEIELVNKIEKFWTIKSNDEIIELELKCKKVFQEYLTPTGFGNKIVPFLISKKDIQIKNESIGFIDKLYYKIFKNKNKIHTNKND
jgi:hypothetical protein